MIKTNNSNLALKLDLRRTVLKASGLKRLRVLDLFAGGGEIWAALRQEFKVESYLPCELKANGAGAEPDSPPLFLEAIGSQALNVIDIDTATEPWEIWAAVARRIQQPAAVFLSAPARGPLSKFARQVLGIPDSWSLTSAAELAQFASRFFLVPRFDGIEIQSARRVTLGPSVNYGLLVRPSADYADHAEVKA
jgi:hypothetical protein